MRRGHVVLHCVGVVLETYTKAQKKDVRVLTLSDKYAPSEPFLESLHMNSRGCSHLSCPAYKPLGSTLRSAEEKFEADPNQFVSTEGFMPERATPIRKRERRKPWSRNCILYRWTQQAYAHVVADVPAKYCVSLPRAAEVRDQ